MWSVPFSVFIEGESALRQQLAPRATGPTCHSDKQISGIKSDKDYGIM